MVSRAWPGSDWFRSKHAIDDGHFTQKKKRPAGLERATPSAAWQARIASESCLIAFNAIECGRRPFRLLARKKINRSGWRLPPSPPGLWGKWFCKANTPAYLQMVVPEARCLEIKRHRARKRDAPADDVSQSRDSLSQKIAASGRLPSRVS